MSGVYTNLAKIRAEQSKESASTPHPHGALEENSEKKTSSLANQQTSKLVKKQTSLPGNQLTSKETNQQASKPVNSQTSNQTLTTKEKIKYGTYLREDSILEIHVRAAQTKRKSHEVVQDAVDFYFQHHKK